MKSLTLIIVGLILTSCSELMIVGGLSGAAVSQSPAVRAYNGVDVLTIGKTDKSIKVKIITGIAIKVSIDLLKI